MKARAVTDLASVPQGQMNLDQLDPGASKKAQVLVLLPQYCGPLRRLPSHRAARGIGDERLL